MTLSQNFTYSFQECRSEKQVKISQKLVQALTEHNLALLNKIDTNLSSKQGYQYIKEHRQQYLFVLMHGLPSVQKQFDFLELPGETLHIYPKGYDPKLQGQAEKMQAFKNADLYKQAAILHNTLQSEHYKHRKIFFVNHSYGAFIMANYFRRYGQDRIVGIISIGQVPLRIYPYLTEYAKIEPLWKTQEYLLKQTEKIAKYYYDLAKQRTTIHLKDNYQIISFLKTVPEMVKTIEFLRKAPKVLKLIIYGADDVVFNRDIINEVGIYYSYVDKIPQSQDNFYCKFLEKKYSSFNPNITIKQSQPKFVYYLSQGKHSIHFQSKFKQTIKRAAQEYLDAIGSYEKAKKI